MKRLNLGQRTQPQLLSQIDKFTDTQLPELCTKFAAMCFGICSTDNGQGCEQVGRWMVLTAATAARNQSVAVTGATAALLHPRATADSWAILI